MKLFKSRKSKSQSNSVKRAPRAPRAPLPFFRVLQAVLKAQHDYNEFRKAEQHLQKIKLSTANIAAIVSAVRDSTHRDVVVTIRTRDSSGMLQEVDFRAMAEHANQAPANPTEREILNQLTSTLMG